MSSAGLPLSPHPLTWRPTLEDQAGFDNFNNKIALGALNLVQWPGDPLGFLGHCVLFSKGGVLLAPRGAGSCLHLPLPSCATGMEEEKLTPKLRTWHLCLYNGMPVTDGLKLACTFANQNKQHCHTHKHEPQSKT